MTTAVEHPDHTPWPEALGLPATVGEVLRVAQRLGLERLDAQLLLAHHLQRSRSWVLAHADEALPAALGASLCDLLQRRADGVPLAYLTGSREFHGLRLSVGPEVLDPRPDTEVLVDWALELLAGELAAVPEPQLLDLGTGSGAIALAVKHGSPRTCVRASDLSAPALAVARGNGQRLGLEVLWLQGDWWAVGPLPALHLVLSNPPYIAAADPHLPGLRHEPLLALSPGGDGLAALNALVDGAPPHLRPGGWLLLEHGWDQAAAVRSRLVQAGFCAVQTRRDLSGHERCSGGRWRP